MALDDTFNQGLDGEINSPDFDNGKNDIKAISNASQALAIAQKLEWNDRERDIRRARVLSAFNGSAPFCDSDLVAKAQGYRYNVSFGYLEGLIGRAVVPYNELTVDFANLTEIDAENISDAKKRILQQEFAKIVQKWGKWAKFVTRLNQDLVLNGYDCAIFPSDYDPFPIFVAQKSGFVDEGAPNDVNDLELFTWKKPYMLHELYLKITDADVANKAGWNVENVKSALMAATPESIWNQGSNTSGVWTNIESAIRGGSLYSSIVGAKLVNTFHVFATEIDGSVTHYIVLDGIKAGSDLKRSDLTNGSELFKKEKRFPSMRDFLVYFDLETGDGTWHGSRGLGQRGFNTHKALDKLRCSVLDQAFVSGLTLLQPGDQVSQEDFQLAVIGPFAVIPQGIQISATTLPAISNTTFQVDSLLASTSEQRLGDVIPQAQSPLDPAETATAAKIKEGRSQLITRGNLKRYIDPISQCLSIMVRRLLKSNSPNPYAKEFQKEIKRRGITDDDIKEVRGARNTGRIDDILGSTAANTQIIFQEFRGDPAIDQANLKYRRITSVLDSDAADELIISDKDQTRQIESRRFQEMEITSIQNGLKIPVSARDNHEVHLETVLEWLGATIQAQAQGLNTDIIPLMKEIAAHGSEHLSFLEQDKSKKQISKGMKDRLKEAVDTIKTLEKQSLQIASAAVKQAKSLATTPQEHQQTDQVQSQIEQRQQSI